MPVPLPTTNHTSPLTIDLSEPQLRLSGAVSQSRKRLRFAPAEIVEYLTELNSDERRAYWWSPQEVDCMMSKASYSAEESRKNKVLVDAVDQALREARRTALMANHSHDNTISPIPSFDNMSTTTTDQGLKLWCQYGHSRRGLEKAVSRIHQTTRNNIVKKARSKVIELSQQQQQHAGAGSDDNSEDVIRSTYEKASRSSVLFAQMIASADAQAALYPFPATTAERRRSTTHIKRNDSMSSTSSLMTTVSSGSNRYLNTLVVCGGSPVQHYSHTANTAAVCLQEVSNHQQQHQLQVV